MGIIECVDMFLYNMGQQCPCSSTRGRCYKTHAGVLLCPSKAPIVDTLQENSLFLYRAGQKGGFF